MRLCGMHQEWMTQIHGSGRAGRNGLGHAARQLLQLRGQFHTGHSGRSCQSEPARNPQMRTQPNARGRILAGDIGKQKQHQQSSSP